MLSWDERQNVSYCIPLYLRNEQIRLNVKLVKDRLTPPEGGIITEPIAVVGFGPSLKETWEEIRRFNKIITCSGAHKFLLERGIVPTWHVEVDPRAYKITLLGTPHPDVHYLPCSAVHPDYLRHLLKHNAKVSLWHVFGTEDSSQRVISRNEWMITGGCDAGLRALTMARFLGYVNVHLFGFDGSSPEQGGARHADFHPNPLRAVSEVERGGRKFFTTPSMLEAARGIFHELNQLPDVKPTFYGDGLIQHEAKTWERTNFKPTIIAAIQAPLISDEMLSRHKALHQSEPEYGGSGYRWARVVCDLVGVLKANTALPSVLDYGCGKGFLAEELDFPIWEYDPAIPGKERLPKPADLVICTDVLEHIEPDQLDAVLDDLRRVTKRIGVFAISTSPAFKKFEDGSNTHRIVMPKTWWQMKLAEYFEIGKTMERNMELIFILGPQAKPKKMVARSIRVGERPKGNCNKKNHKKVLAKLVNDCGWERGAEVGCLRGDTTFYLLEQCPKLSVVAVDIWQPFPGQYENYEAGGQDPLTLENRVVPFELIEEVFRERGSKYNGRLKVLKGLSWEMADDVPDGSLDFAFIDADHTAPSVRKDILAWRPKVKPGGMLLGHDIHLPTVKEVVDELCPGWEHLEEEIWAVQT